MQINEIIKYEVNGKIFDSEEEANLYMKRLKFEQDLISILDEFCYRGMDQGDVFDGIMTHKDEIINLLLKNQEVLNADQ